MSKNIFIFSDTKQVEDELQELYTKSLSEKIESSCSIKLFKKIITHSDVITSGKNTKKSETYQKNILNYLSVEEMEKIDYNLRAKQSNISLPREFYEELGIKQLERRDGEQKEKHNHILLNDYIKVSVLNRNLNYFTSEYTDKISEKLCKNKINVNLKLEEIYKNNDDEYIELNVHHAIHGIGTSADKVFSELRKNIYRQDILYLLKIEKSDEKELIIILKKNPKFFNILEINNNQYTDYLLRLEELKKRKCLNDVLLLETDEKTRKMQKVWRDNLAYELMNYTSKEGIIFCPISGIEIEYEKLGTLMRASHIKSYADCTSVEAYDLNNGILMTANADALFDKYIFTIDQTKKFELSEIMLSKYDWEGKLHFRSTPSELILNDKRMKYLEDHNDKFQNKETQRRHKEN